MAAQLPETTMIAGGAQVPLPSLVSAGRLRAQSAGRALRLWIPVGILVFLLGMCFVWPHVWNLPPAVNGSILDAGEAPFSPGHFLGTDQVGNDMFSKVVYGGQIAFEISVAVTLIGMVLGSLMGVIAGFFGGWTDTVISRVLDVLIAFPALVLALAIAEVLGPSELHLIWALSVFSVPAFGRVTRGATLAVRGLPYIMAASLSGTRGWRIMVRHVLPNIIPAMVTFSLLGIGVVVILEGALDFLGLGIQRPAASWGSMIADGQTVLTAQPEYVLIPSFFLLILVVAVNMLGDALRERWGVR
jgi:peptide/nickel transport system permease protein